MPSEARTGISRSHPLYGRTTAAIFLIGISTFLPMYAVQPLVVPIAAEFNRTAAQASWLMGAAAAAIAACVLPLGAASARLGRARMLLIGLVVLVAAALGTALAPTWPLVLAMRTLTGVGVGAIIVSAMAWVVEQSTPLAATVIGGLYISGTSVGGLTGRLISSYIAEVTDWRVGVLAVAGVCVATGVTAHLLLPRIRPAAAQARKAAAEPAARNRVFRLHIYAIGFVSMAVFSGVYTAIAFRVAEAPFNAGPAITGSLFLTYLAGTLTSAISGRVVARTSIRLVLVGGFLVCGLGVAVTLIDRMLAVVLGLLILAAGFFIVHGLANSLAPAHSPRPSAGSARYSLSYYAGNTVGAVMMGAAWDASGWPLVVGISLGLMGVGALLGLTARPNPD